MSMFAMGQFVQSPDTGKLGRIVEQTQVQGTWWNYVLVGTLNLGYTDAELSEYNQPRHEQ